MDDSLLAEFQGAFSVSAEINDTRAPHPHYILYKQKREGYGDQEARRKRILVEQKARRRDFSDYVRKVLDGDVSEDGDELQEDGGIDEVDDSMEVSGDKKGKKKYFCSHRNQLMLSEWMIDIPKDFECWYMVICPIGRRSLVISARGTTTAYSRSGACLNNFPSLLPGGCRKTFQTARDHCILDCIYHEVTRTFFVLDVMCWRGHPVYNSDTEFRFYWLRTKLNDEGEKLSTHSRRNPFMFLPLDVYPCSGESITKALSVKWPIEVDGLLFFHKEAHYTIGRSPLALWLKPQMVPDILGLAVSAEFLSCTPVMTEAKMEVSASSKKTKGKIEGKMEVSSSSDNTTDMAQECVDHVSMDDSSVAP